MMTDKPETEKSWSNIAPNTNDISVINNYTNILVETTTNRVEDRMLIDMINNMNTHYTIREDGLPAVNSYAVRTAEMVINNAGVTTPVLYGFDGLRDGMISDNVSFVGDDAVIKNGGSIEFGKLLDKSLNFNIYAGKNTEGYYELDIDNKYTQNIIPSMML